MRRDPLTMTEVAKLFRDEVKTRYDPPSETQLAVLLFNLSGRIAQLDLEFIAALRPLSQAAADFSHYGWHTYQAIEALTAIRPDWSMEMPVIARVQLRLAGGGGGGAVGAHASAAEPREGATIAG